MDLMDDNNQPEVIMAKPRFPLPPKIPLILGGTILLFIAGFVLFQKYSPQLLPLPSQSPQERISIPCPSDPGFCEQAQKVEKDGKYTVLGAKMDPDTPIYAVFDGKIIKRTVSLGKQSGGEKFYQITLVDEKNNLQAVYYLKKITLLPNLVKKGDIIGLTDSETISYLNNYNLGFALLAKDNREIPADGIEFR